MPVRPTATPVGTSAGGPPGNGARPMSRLDAITGLRAGRGIDGDDALLADLGHIQASVRTDFDALGPVRPSATTLRAPVGYVDLADRTGRELGDVDQRARPVRHGDRTAQLLHDNAALLAVGAHLDEVAAGQLGHVYRAVGELHGIDRRQEITQRRRQLAVLRSTFSTVLENQLVSSTFFGPSEMPIG